MAFRLTKDMHQLDGQHLQTSQCCTAEEVGRVVIIAQELPFRPLNHRSQLVQVADHQQLHTAKGQFGATVATQHTVHAIEQIRPYHADLVDNQQVKAFDDILFFLTEPVLAGVGLATRDERPERHLKKRVESYPAGVDCRNPGGCGDYQPFVALFFNGLQKRGLTGASLTGEKNRAVGVLDKFFSQLQFGGGNAHQTGTGKKE